MKLLLEVLLIATGVFLGLMGEQWRESRQHHELAVVSLERFRAELTANRAAVAAVKDYHASLKPQLDAYMRASADERKKISLGIQGVRPAHFQHSAWDLSLAMQSLAYVPQDLVLSLSEVYTTQQDYAVLSSGLVQAIYLRPPSEELNAFIAALSVYYSDITLMEPRLIERYDMLLPQIARALGEPAKAAE